jgi:hypothetical protein
VLVALLAPKKGGGTGSGSPRPAQTTVNA